MREPNSVAGDIEKTTGRSARRPAVLVTLEEKGLLVSGYDDPTPPPRRSRAAQREREHFLHPASHSFHPHRPRRGRDKVEGADSDFQHCLSSRSFGTHDTPRWWANPFTCSEKQCHSLPRAA